MKDVEPLWDKVRAPSVAKSLDVLEIHVLFSLSPLSVVTKSISQMINYKKIPRYSTTGLGPFPFFIREAISYSILRVKDLK